MTAARGLAFVIALLFLLVSLSAEAKKKKPAKKHKTPAAKVKGKSKSTDRGLPPPEPGAESDEASSDEKPSKKPGADSGEGEGEEKETKAPPPAPEPEEEPVKKPPPKAAKAPPPKADEAEAGGPVAFRIGVGGRALFRKLTWTDAGNRLAPYSLSPGPEVGIWLEAFPLAFVSESFAGNIGLYGHFNYGFGASSNTMAGTKLTTKYQDFLVGLKIRIPIGSFIPYLAGGYGMQKFTLEPVAPDRPNFNYALVTGGGGARIQFTPAFDLDLGAGFLYVLTPGKAAGEVASPNLYPNSTANGVDVTLSIGFRLVSMIGIRVGGDFRQFGLATHWKTGDMAGQAGGALDRNITVWGGLELVFDGLGGGQDEGGEAPAPKKPPPKKPPPREVEPDETDKADTDE